MRFAAPPILCMKYVHVGIDICGYFRDVGLHNNHICYVNLEFQTESNLAYFFNTNLIIVEKLYLTGRGNLKR